MSDPAPAPQPSPSPPHSAFQEAYNEVKTFVLGFVVAMAVFAQFRAPVPTPIPIPTPTPTPTPTPAPTDFFFLGKAYKQSLGSAYADAWDRNFVVAPGDDLDSKLLKVKEQWDSTRTAAFGASIAPEFDKIAPARKPVDQSTADALNKARSDFARGLRDGG